MLFSSEGRMVLAYGLRRLYCSSQSVKGKAAKVKTRVFAVYKGDEIEKYYSESAWMWLS